VVGELHCNRISKFSLGKKKSVMKVGGRRTKKIRHGVTRPLFHRPSFCFIRTSHWKQLCLSEFGYLSSDTD